jgi:hypothetical protein
VLIDYSWGDGITVKNAELHSPGWELQIPFGKLRAGSRVARDDNPMKQSDACQVSAASDFGIKVEKRFQAGLKLLFDLFLTALENVHSDVGVAPVLQLDGGLADLGYFFRWQQPHSVH